MGSTATFPISFDRQSRLPMTALRAGPAVSCVSAGDSSVEVRMGWAFHGRFPRQSVASAKLVDGGLSELRGPFRLNVLRGVNYWRGTALVNGAASGLVEIRLDRAKWMRLGPLGAPVRRVIVSVEDPAGLVDALSPGEV